jgi:hypothetical protein
MSRLSVVLALGLLGYLLLDRGFGWIHIPGTPLFIGEIVLAVGILALMASRIRISSLLVRSQPLTILMLYMGWGAVVLIGGFGLYGINAIRDSAIWYYGAFSFLIVASLSARSFDWWIDSYARFLPWIALWLPVAGVLGAMFRETDVLLVPDSGVSILAHGSAEIALHAAVGLAFIWAVQTSDTRLNRLRMPLSIVFLLTILVMAMRSRASIVAIGIGGLVFLAGLGRIRSGFLLKSVTILAITFSLALIIDLKVDLYSNGREISARQIADNMTSLINPEDSSENLRGTASWRLDFWKRVVADVSANQPLTGLGMGTDIRTMFGEQDEDPPARNPHSSHVNVFARTGWVGAVLWIALWSSWYIHVLRARQRFRRVGLDRAAGLALVLLTAVTMFLINGIFNEVIEGPHGGIWLWALFGFGAALAMVRTPQPSTSALSHA